MNGQTPLVLPPGVGGLKPGEARVVEVPDTFDSFLLVHDGTCLRAYRNACPHQGTPLENPLGRVIDDSGQYLVCSTHGARFRLSDGLCVAGPCQGRALTAVAIAP